MSPSLSYPPKQQGKIRLWIIGLIVLVAIIYTIFASKNAEAPIVSNSPTDHKAANVYEAIASTQEKEEIENSKVSVHITKTIVTGLSSEAINNAVNETLSTAIDDMKKSFLADVEGAEVISDEQKHQLTITSSAPISAREGTFYIDVDVYSYYSGAAHPLSQKIVFNFVKENGQLIRLEDILKKDSGSASATNVTVSGALAAVSKLAKPLVLNELAKMIATSGGEEYPNPNEILEESGLAPTVENFGVFYLKDESIDWIFGQYQVAPYVFGEIKVSIPLSELKPYLAERTWLK